MILDVCIIQKRLRNVTLKIRQLANVQDCGQPKHHHVTSPTGCFRTRFNTPQPLDSPDMSTSSLLCQADKFLCRKTNWETRRFTKPRVPQEDGPSALSKDWSQVMKNPACNDASQNTLNCNIEFPKKKHTSIRITEDIQRISLETIGYLPIGTVCKRDGPGGFCFSFKQNWVESSISLCY